MPLNLASPGIVIREVDLTIGRVDPTSGSTGALVAPFEKGPVGDPQLIQNEEDLLQTFGQPYSTDKHYEHWLVASSFLAYGGTLSVVRADDFNTVTGVGIKNAFVGTASSIRIKSSTHYNQLGYDENTITGATFAANTPGSWANGIKVATIDAGTDQTLTGISTVGLSTATIQVGAGIKQDVTGRKKGLTTLGGYLKGIITKVDSSASTVDVKVVSHVDAAGTEHTVDYNPEGAFEFKNGTVTITGGGINNSIDLGTETVSATADWFENQSIPLKNDNTLSWDQLANKPQTSSYVGSRGGRFDEIHVVVIDDTGSITGNAGTILEKHLSLSKAKDAEFSVGATSYWRKYLAVNSRYIFGGSQPIGVTTTAYSSGWTADADSDWDQNGENVNFGGSGSNTYTLANGLNYSGIATITSGGALNCGADDIISGLQLFTNKEETEVDFILMGSANYDKDTAAGIADEVIATAEARKDAVGFVSPYRQAFLNDSVSGAVTVSDIDEVTTNIKSFYSDRASSTYAVFDSGYKYMYDRFNNTFRYVPLNGDIAGLCARTSLEQFPWFSPAGTARGAILNATKLVYNPGKKQRDILYSNRINPVISSPGAGIILFGDKTAFAKASAFDRINVRRLFIYLEDAIAAAAKDQLFEFNDEITRTNFVNIIEPFLRDVQAKRGIFDFVVICDETNNTAAVIDANEFVADIFIKPARSINFIGLTFVATRTGVAFEEVIGSV